MRTARFRRDDAPPPPAKPPYQGGVRGKPWSVDVRKTFYNEDEVTRWIAAQLRGEAWHPSATPDPRPTLISRREVLRRVPFSYPTIWKLEKTGRFPTPIKIGPAPRGLLDAAAE